MSTDTDAPDDPRGDLEDALSAIYGVARTLMQCGERRDAEPYAYLGGQLLDHHAEALDAFSRIFKLDEYAENREAQA